MTRSRCAAAALVLLAALTAGAGVARAQSNTAEMLQRAIRHYEDVEIEQSLVILNQIISPESPFVVTPEQRVLAYKYLGACLALQRGEARRDTAVRYFQAALERDPFTDLDPRTFSPIQLQAFRTARTRSFAVALRPVTRDTVDPRSELVRFSALATHAAGLRLELRREGQLVRSLFSGEAEGLRDVDWDGLTGQGQLAPPGRYELLLVGESRLITVPMPLADTARLFLDVTHQHAPLEDTLPELRAAELLPEQHPASAATYDLLKGLAVTSGALVIQNVVAGSDLGVQRTGPGVVAGAGLVVGVSAFFVRQSHRRIPANIAANAEWRAERARQNAAILERNRALLAETRLVLAPAGGVGR